MIGSKGISGRRIRCFNGLMLAGFGMAALSLVAAVPASAHHPIGGATPTTFWHGLLSGIGHPVIGFDHLAFIIAVGVASAFIGVRYLTPLVFCCSDGGRFA